MSIHRLVPLLLAVSLLAAVTACSTDEPTNNHTNEANDDQFTEGYDFNQGLVDQEQNILDELTDASRYIIELTISDDYLTIDGHQRINFSNTEDVSLESVFFYLFPNVIPGRINVSSTMINGQTVDVEYLFSTSVLRVPLPQPMEPGDEILIEMDYQIRLTAGVNQIRSLMGYIDGILLLDGFYPVIPVHDDRGWNVTDPPINGDKTFLDVSYYQVSVTAPIDLTIITTGIEVDKRIDGSNQVASFISGPSRDFCLIASDHYTITSRSIGQTTINSYSIIGNNASAVRALDVATDAIESFNRRLGIYPYTELDIVSVPLPNPVLGVEYPGIIGINDDIYSISVYFEATVAHEIGHQWFYNVVGNDQVNEPWLDEALVQYITGLYFLDTYGESGWQGIRDSWIGRWDRIDREMIPIGMPSDYYRGLEFGAIIYGRGPLFIEALAETMGQQIFDVFLTEYYNTNKWGIAYTGNFIEIAEKTCNCQLEDIFNDWLYSDQSQ